MSLRNAVLFTLLATGCSNFEATCLENGSCNRGAAYAGTAGTAGTAGVAGETSGGSGGEAGTAGSGGTTSAGTAGGGTGGSSTAGVAGTGGTAGAPTAGTGGTGGAGEPAVDCGQEPCGYLEAKATMIGLDDHSGITVKLTPGTFETVTASDGRYRIDDVPVGTYAAAFASGQYSAELTIVKVPYGDNAMVLTDALKPLPDIELMRGTLATADSFVTTSPDGRFLAFIPRDIADDGVYSLEVDSGTVVELDSAAVAAHSYIISPDSSSLYWITVDGELKVAPLGGGGTPTILDQDAHGGTSSSSGSPTLFFSDDGSWLVYTVGASSSSWKMRRVRDGKEALLGTRVHIYGDLLFSSDGQSVLCATLEGNLRLLRLSSGVLSELSGAMFSARSLDDGPRFLFSKDGSKVLYQDASGLHIATDSGAQIERLTVADAAASAALQLVAFTEDDDRVIYVEEQTGPVASIRSVPSSGGEATVLSTEFARGQAHEVGRYPILVTPDAVLYIVDDDEDSVGTLNAVAPGGGTPVQLASGVYGHYLAPPKLSFDGARVVYVTDDGDADPNEGVLHSQPVDGTAAIELGTDVVRDAVYLSPDSDYVVFLEVKDGIGNLMSADLATGARLTLGSGVDMPDRYEDTPVRTSDGQRVLFISGRLNPDAPSEPGTLRVATWDGSSVVALSENVSSVVSSSPGGKRISYRANGVLTISPIWGGAATPIAGWGFFSMRWVAEGIHYRMKLPSGDAREALDGYYIANDIGP
jgi:hypothetical protein